MPKKILVILGHPHSQSLCGGLTQAYEAGAYSVGAEVQVIRLGELTFDPVTPRYDAPTMLDPDLQQLQKTLHWADHIALIYPFWWGGAPGPLKCALERVLLPGFAFKYHTKGLGWDRLLTGRSGELLETMDTPPWIYRYLNGAAGDRVIAQRTLEFCGVKPVRSIHFGSVRTSTPDIRARWLKKARELGAQAGR